MVARTPTSPPRIGSHRARIEEVTANLERMVATESDSGWRNRVLNYERLRVLADIADELRGVRDAIDQAVFK